MTVPERLQALKDAVASLPAPVIEFIEKYGHCVNLCGRSYARPLLIENFIHDLLELLNEPSLHQGP